MTEAGGDDQQGGPVELLDDGLGPQPSRPGRNGLGRAVCAARSAVGSVAFLRRLDERGRLVLGGLAVVAVVVATSVVGGHEHQSAAAASPPAPPLRLQLLLDQYSYSAQPGGFSLRLSVVNYGPDAIDLLAAHLPQAGASPVPGPGGDLAFTSALALPPEVSATVVIPVTVQCPQVLTAALADHVDVTLGRGGHRVGVVHLALAPLGSLLDEARHAACGVASASGSVYASYVGGSLKATRPEVITATLSVADVGDAAATITLVGTDPASVALSSLDRPVTVVPGDSRTLALTWHILDCAATQAVRWPSVRLSVTVPTSTATNSYGLDDRFGTAWQLALSQACR